MLRDLGSFLIVGTANRSLADALHGSKKKGGESKEGGGVRLTRQAAPTR